MARARSRRRRAFSVSSVAACARSPAASTAPSGPSPDIVLATSGERTPPSAVLTPAAPWVPTPLGPSPPVRGDGSCFLGDGAGSFEAPFFPFFPASSNPSDPSGSREGVPGRESAPAGEDPDDASGLGTGMVFLVPIGESNPGLGGDVLGGVTASSESVPCEPGAETISESSAELVSSASFAARSAASRSASTRACSAARAAASAALTAAAAAAAAACLACSMASASAMAAASASRFRRSSARFASSTARMAALAASSSASFAASSASSASFFSFFRAFCFAFLLFLAPSISAATRSASSSSAMSASCILIACASAKATSMRLVNRCERTYISTVRRPRSASRRSSLSTASSPAKDSSPPSVSESGSSESTEAARSRIDKRSSVAMEHLFCEAESHTLLPLTNCLNASSAFVDPMSSAWHPQQSASMTSVDVTSFSLKNRLTMPLSRTSAFSDASCACAFPWAVPRNSRMSPHRSESSWNLASWSRRSSRNLRQIPSTFVRYTLTSSRLYWGSRHRNGLAGFSWITCTWALITSVSATVNPSRTFESSMNFFHPQSCSFLQNRCRVSEYLDFFGSLFTTAMVNCAK